MNASADKLAVDPTADPCIRDGDTAWVLTATLLVLGMIPGLALFESGLLRAKHTVSVLTQVVCGCSILGLMWYLFGFSLVYGESVKGLIGSPASYPALVGVPHNGCFEGMHIPGLAYATFQMMFASITPLLMTGAFAERFLWKPYVIFIIAWEILVFYPVAHWIWGKGWLADMGALDFAGGIVIHTTAGAGALVSAHLVHQRRGFIESHAHFPPSNIPIACVGGAFLWMGWFGFNAGSALSSTYVASTVVANTQIASTTCACVWLMLAWIRSRPNIEDILNGAIAGLAGITPAAGYVSPLSSMVIGLVLGFSSFFSIDLIKFRWHIDDALDVSSVHGITGIVGSFAIGFCADKYYNPSIQHDGVVAHGSTYLLGVQALAVLACAAWSGLWTFLILKATGVCMPISMHNMSDRDHQLGLDELEHDCTAYGEHSHHWVDTNKAKTKKRRASRRHSQVRISSKLLTSLAQSGDHMVDIVSGSDSDDSSDEDQQLLRVSSTPTLVNGQRRQSISRDCINYGSTSQHQRPPNHSQKKQQQSLSDDKSRELVAFGMSKSSRP